VEPEDIGRVLNEHFTSFFTEENEGDGMEFRKSDCGYLVQFHTAEDKVLEVLAALKLHKSPGRDEL